MRTGRTSREGKNQHDLKSADHCASLARRHGQTREQAGMKTMDGYYGPRDYPATRRAENLNTRPATLARLVENADPHVVLAVAAHPSTPPATLARIVTGTPPTARSTRAVEAALTNPACPLEAIVEASRDDDAGVFTATNSMWSTPTRTLHARLTALGVPQALLPAVAAAVIRNDHAGSGISAAQCAQDTVHTLTALSPTALQTAIGLLDTLTNSNSLVNDAVEVAGDLAAARTVHVHRPTGQAATRTSHTT